MYLMVEIDGQESKVYHLTKAEILIGSGPQNHIILNLPSISKFHLRLLYESEQWQVIDKGSTNGTYFGKNQLTPGKRCLINPGESIRLGDKVILKLLTEAQKFMALPEIELKPPKETRAALTDHDKTQVVSLSDLEAAKILSEKKRRKELLEQRNKELRRRKADKAVIIKGFLIALCILSLGVFFNRFWKARQSKIKKDTIINKMKTKFSGDSELEQELEGVRIWSRSLISKNIIINYLKQKKCFQPQTKEFCESKELYNFRDNGAYFHQPNSIFIYLHQKSWPATIRSNLLPEDLPSVEAYHKLVFLHFVKTFLAKINSEDFSGDMNIYVVFYFHGIDDVAEIYKVAAVKLSVAPMIESFLESEKFPGPYTNTEEFVKKYDKFYTFY